MLITIEVEVPDAQPENVGANLCQVVHDQVYWHVDVGYDQGMKTRLYYDGVVHDSYYGEQ